MGPRRAVTVIVASRTHVFLVFCVLGAALVCASCGEAGSGSAWVVRDTLPGGVVRLRYGALPSESAPVLRPDLRIGAMEGESWEVFGDVRSIDAAPDGTIYVLDYQASEVRAFDADGGFVRIVARKGEGPGELTEANGMVLAADGTLWIQDHGKWEMIGVDARGQEVGRFPMPIRSYGYVWNGTLDDRGRLWKPTSYSDRRQTTFPPPEGLLEGSSRSYLKWYDPASDATDSVYLGEFSYRSFIATTGTGYMSTPIPFAPQRLTQVDPGGGLWTVTTDAYRIARLDDVGDTVMILEVAAEPLPVTAADRRDYVLRMAERSPDMRRAGEEIAALMPEAKPLVDQLVVDDVGRLWVRRVGAQEEPPLYDVFGRDGEYRGSIRFGFRPSPYVPPRVRDGSLYALVLDSLDVPTVVRAELPDLGEGS